MGILVELANISYLISYSVRNVLILRVFAILGGVLLLPYYYLQPIPLLVPIVWGLAFIALNLFWVVYLLLERRPVNLNDEEQRLYRLVFRTLTPREMLHLLKFARWENKRAGEYLEKEGEPYDRLSVVVFGRGTIYQGGKEVGEVKEGQFAGKITFLKDEIAKVSVVATEPTRYVSWHKDVLRKYLSSKPELAASLALILELDLKVMLESAWNRVGEKAPGT